MVVDHCQQLMKCISETRLSLYKLNSELLFLHKKVKKGDRLDEQYLEVADEFERLAKQIRENIEGSEEDGS